MKTVSIFFKTVSTSSHFHLKEVIHFFPKIPKAKQRHSSFRGSFILHSEGDFLPHDLKSNSPSDSITHNSSNEHIIHTDNGYFSNAFNSRFASNRGHSIYIYKTLFANKISYKCLFLTVSHNKAYPSSIVCIVCINLRHVNYLRTHLWILLPSLTIMKCYIKMNITFMTNWVIRYIVGLPYSAIKSWRLTIVFTSKTPWSRNLAYILRKITTQSLIVTMFWTTKMFSILFGLWREKKHIN